jgi:DNA-binding winged helix-turn-helix (wHTH) protein
MIPAQEILRKNGEDIKLTHKEYLIVEYMVARK